MTINVLSAAADVVIAVALCFLLQKSRTGFTRSVPHSFHRGLFLTEYKGRIL